MDLLIAVIFIVMTVSAGFVGVIVIIYPTKFVKYHTDMEAGDELPAKLLATSLVILSLFFVSISTLIIL
jgi:hypothetical protein